MIRTWFFVLSFEEADTSRSSVSRFSFCSTRFRSYHPGSIDREIGTYMAGIHLTSKVNGSHIYMRFQPDSAQLVPHELCWFF